jgi:NAD-dependent aldehyde dehydrogenases
MGTLNAAEVIEWAKQFLSQAEQELTAEEKREQEKYAILIQNPKDKFLLSKLLDESSQIRSNKRLARRMKTLFDRYGIPSFFDKTDTFLIKLFAYFGYWFDFIAVPVFKKRLRSDTAKVIINEEASLLNRHLNERKRQHIGQNVNLLGEVVLGDGEADHRYRHYLEALKDPRINYISIKVSGIYAQINPLNYEQNKKDLCDRLSRIYQQAIDHPFVDDDGMSKAKFVNLDMEEYKDTELTLDVFLAVLSQPQFKNYYAGIVVQAYLPDAWGFQTRLLDFAKKRVAEGGAPVKMRLVKGANLQMESIISSLKGWANPVFDSKVKVDANHLHVLERALEPENARAVHVGVATHNFFSIAYAYLLSRNNGVDEYVTFEMLEGMANHLPRVMRKLGRQIILYTPVVSDEHFLNAVSYLVRRLDENTGEDNFLSYSFNLKVDSDHWKFLETQFLQAYALKDSLDITPLRQQDRTKEGSTIQAGLNSFKNEPDTNFDLKANKVWVDSIRRAWMRHKEDKPYEIPVQIGAKHSLSEKKRLYLDRSQNDEVCVCKVNMASHSQVRDIVMLAEKDASEWRKSSLYARNRMLHKVADNLAAKRGHLIGCMSAITGKTFYEGDVEVSEAVDFCRYYPISMSRFEALETIKISPKGIVLIIPPWNFPLAIPVGGVAAALSGGNSVILKPATVAYPVAWEFVQCFWDAGIPKDALQIVCPDSRESLGYLTVHPAISHVILTGGTETAFRLLESNPTCPLSAETGGKNAIILTASGDRDHAIQNVMTSAFSNAGQKCSACSLLVLDKSIYNDADFKSKLIDAVTSLRTGSVWDGGTVVGPMITPENEKLLYAINHLDDGEWWLVEPEFADEKHYMLKPCVKWGVKPGSYTFTTELFAPVLAVVCMDDLEHGIELANSSDYGLTAGLQSLDEAEHALWKEKIEAGNLYINRGITGAVVNRQPFGGMKLSAFGGGIKAGGPNYVSCFVNVEETPVYNPKNVAEYSLFLHLLKEEERPRFTAAVDSYLQNYREEFSVARDIHHLYGEQNLFRYLPLKKMVFRIQPEDNLCDALMVYVAAQIAKTPMVLSLNRGDEAKLKKLSSIVCDGELVVQSDLEFQDDLELYDRVRSCSCALPLDVFKRAASLGKYIATAKPLPEGRLELLNYLKEQSITYEYHRYGSILEIPE